MLRPTLLRHVAAGTAVRLALAALLLGYVLWSQFALHRATAALEIERRRVYHIADQLELWKLVAIRDHGRLDREALGRDARHIELTDAPGAAHLAAGDRAHTLIYDAPDAARRSQLDRYFSDRVLANYFYVVTDAQGQIKDMSWDKP
jgi:hypothetical protein